MEHLVLRIRNPARFPQWPTNRARGDHDRSWRRRRRRSRVRGNPTASPGRPPPRSRTGRGNSRSLPLGWLDRIAQTVRHPRVVAGPDPHRVLLGLLVRLRRQRPPRGPRDAPGAPTGSRTSPRRTPPAEPAATRHESPERPRRNLELSTHDMGPIRHAPGIAPHPRRPAGDSRSEHDTTTAATPHPRHTDDRDHQPPIRTDTGPKTRHGIPHNIRPEFLSTPANRAVPERAGCHQDGPVVTRIVGAQQGAAQVELPYSSSARWESATGDNHPASPRIGGKKRADPVTTILPRQREAAGRQPSLVTTGMLRHSRAVGWAKPAALSRLAGPGPDLT
ncbi:hypothetical protein ABIA38_009173 [Embleya sp. AB8]